MPLTEQQIKRQDVIDNAIDAIIAEVKPDYQHDIVVSGAIRDLIVREVSYLLNVSKEEFYPYEEI